MLEWHAFRSQCELNQVRVWYLRWLRTSVWERTMHLWSVEESARVQVATEVDCKAVQRSRAERSCYFGLEM